jgi:tetratricopeptide (TPR) repeat protein
LSDEAISTAQRLRPDLPEVHLAYARHLLGAYRDYERARGELAIAKRGLTNNSEAILLEAGMDRLQGNPWKTIRTLKELITWDPGNSDAVAMLAETLYGAREFRAAEQAYDRLILLMPDRPTIKIQKAFLTFLKTGDDTAVHAAIAALPPTVRDNAGVLSLRLTLAVNDRNWQQARELIEKMKGGLDNADFAYGLAPVPVECYSILLARLQGEQPERDTSLVEAREFLSQWVKESPQDVGPLNELAIVDALLARKEDAISEIRRAAEMMPVSRDAWMGTVILKKLAIVYAWTDEPDLAFETLAPLTRMQWGVAYGDLKVWPYWDPLRKDPRFDKLLAELAPRD